MKKLFALVLSLAFVSAIAFGAEKPAASAPVSKSVSEASAVTPVAKAAKKHGKKPVKKAETKTEAKAVVTPAAK